MTSNLYRHGLQVEALLCTARSEHAAALRASAPPILHAALTSISARDVDGGLICTVRRRWTANLYHHDF